MKKIILLLLPALSAYITSAQISFTIEGKFKNKKKQGTMSVHYGLGGYHVSRDTIRNGKFLLKGNLKAEEIVQLRYTPLNYSYEKGKTDALKIFIEGGKITFNATDSVKYAKISGSASNDAYNELMAALLPIENEAMAMRPDFIKASIEKNEAKIKELQEKTEPLKVRRADIYKAFIKKYPKSPVAFMALTLLADNMIDPVVIGPLWDQLDAKLKTTTAAKEFAEQLALARLTEPGKPAMEFVQHDTAGMPVRLSDFRGKYVLIDFWASWCRPCRAENPNVVANYHKYKNKNFTILGVSLDDQGQKKQWLKAIQDDHLEWTQVSDLKGGQNEVAVSYGIRSIPQNLLVGPDGIIVAKNLHEDKLGEMLKKLLGE